MNEEFEKARAEMIEEMSESKKQTVLLESTEEKLIQAVDALIKISKDTASLPIIDKRQRKESRITGVMMIAIALFSAYVSVAVGLVPQEMAREKLNGLFDIAFWWMSKGD